MKAIVYEEYGPPEVLQFKTVGKPEPKSNEVLIKIHATTVTIGDTIMRSLNIPGPWWERLMARLYLGITKPKRSILGMELAGIIESTGHKVTRFKKGDHVLASTFSVNFGGYAEYKCISENGMLALKPENLSFGEAAALIGGGMTALRCLRKGNLQKGQSVLIYGASGAVGTCSVQIAKSFGYVVTGVCSTRNIDLVKSLGADHVIDYTQEDFTQQDVKYDVIFDAVGKTTQAFCKPALKQNGIYLNVLTASGRGETSEELKTVIELAAAEKLKPIIDKEFSFDQIVEAHRYVDGGHKRGNVVVLLNHTDAS